MRHLFVLIVIVSSFVSCVSRHEIERSLSEFQECYIAAKFETEYWISKDSRKAKIFLNDELACELELREDAIFIKRWEEVLISTMFENYWDQFELKNHTLIAKNKKGESRIFLIPRFTECKVYSKGRKAKEIQDKQTTREYEILDGKIFTREWKQLDTGEVAWSHFEIIERQIITISEDANILLNQFPEIMQ